MKRYYILAILIIIVAGLGVYGWGQSKSASKERQEYDKLLEQWKPMVAELSQLRYQYFDVKRKPGEDEIVVVEQTPKRQALKKEFDEKFKKANVTYQKLIDAAVLAYAKDQENNRDIEQFLFYTLRYFMQRDMYEDALKMCDILLNSNVNNPYVIRCAAFAALYTQKYDIVIPFLEKIQKLGILDEFRLGESDFKFLPVFEMLWEQEKNFREREERIDLPSVVLYTTKGEIEILLYEDQAPNTVANFIWLVEKGFYKNIDFDAVITEGIAHVGGTEQYKRVDNLTLQPIVRGNGTPGYVIPDEFKRFDFQTKKFPEDSRFFWRGTVAMDLLRDQPNTAGCKFFILFKPNINCVNKNTAFGRVIRGMDVVCRLQRRNPSSVISLSQLPTPDKILDAKVKNKRNHEYKPMIKPLEKTVPPYPNMPVLPEEEKKDPNVFDIMDYNRTHMP
ncbi:MAG: peptidylprolyl isomerase [Thermoguttaceae bacterium]|nr:peptidylprolyl isomerase [Thermoguttaceae bacterium]